MRAEESQFSAGTACEPCQAMGHFCPAHDFNADDDPACRPCLAGNPCSQKQVRKSEFDKVAASIAQTSVAKPSPPKADPLRGEKLAETMEQQKAQPGPCSWGCGKPRHRGVCAARRAALETNANEQLEAVRAAASKFPSSTNPMVLRGSGTAVVKSEPRADAPQPIPEEDEPLVEPIPAITQEMRDAVKALDPPAAGPVFEVVSRSQVQLRPSRNDRYAELAKRLRALGPGDLLKISLPSKAEANCYAKNFSRRLKKYNLRVKYERHGEVLFLEVKQPISPTSEVSAP